MKIFVVCFYFSLSPFKFAHLGHFREKLENLLFGKSTQINVHKKIIIKCAKGLHVFLKTALENNSLGKADTK